MTTAFVDIKDSLSSPVTALSSMNMELVTALLDVDYTYLASMPAVKLETQMLFDPYTLNLFKGDAEKALQEVYRVAGDSDSEKMYLVFATIVSWLICICGEGYYNGLVTKAIFCISLLSRYHRPTCMPFDGGFR